MYMPHITQKLSSQQIYPPWKNDLLSPLRNSVCNHHSKNACYFIVTHFIFLFPAFFSADMQQPLSVSFLISNAVFAVRIRSGSCYIASWMATNPFVRKDTFEFHVVSVKKVYLSHYLGRGNELHYGQLGICKYLQGPDNMPAPSPHVLSKLKISHILPEYMNSDVLNS